MKFKIIVFTLLLTGILALSCSNGNRDLDVITRCEKLVNTDPEIAKLILDSIQNPLTLSDKSFAKYVLLSCKVADNCNLHFPSHGDIQTACTWYEKRGSNTDKVQMYLYLGRSYVSIEDYKKGLKEYLKAFNIAKDNNLPNQAGYVCSYIGDLYAENNDLFAASAKYEEALRYFKQAENQKSCAFALRDLGRTEAELGFLEESLSYFILADSIADSLNDLFVKSTILNGIGNIYSLKGEYDKAEEFLLTAIELDTVLQLPSLNALVNIYIKQEDFLKANALLDSIKRHDANNDFQYTLNYKYYELKKLEKNTPEALCYLENVFKIFQSDLHINSQESFLELEKKYTNVKLVNDMQKLAIKLQNYFFFLIISIVIILLLIIRSQKNKIRYTNRLSELDNEINELKSKCYNLSKTIIITKEQSQKEKEKVTLVTQYEREIVLLNKKLHDSRRTRLLVSDIGKKLRSTSKTIIPKADEKKITSKMWDSIEKEIKTVYPEFETKIYGICPELSDSDWLYCCFVLFNFDSNEEAILLNINPHSARQKKARIKNKLGFPPDSTNLYDNFIVLMNLT